jgi:copper chaperone for superoxide dismutase
VHEKIENLAGSLAVLKGMGSGIGVNGNSKLENLDAAVCELNNDENLPLNIKGVIRFVQLDEEHCAIDGIVDGLAPGPHAFNVCEFGDLSNGCKSVGNHFNPSNKPHGLPTDQDRVNKMK